MSRTLQHSIVLGVERVHVTGTAKGLWRGRGVGQCPDGGGAVGGRHAGGASFQFVDGHRERRAEHRGVLHHLVGQVEFFAAGFCDWCAEQSARIFQHEIHHFSRNGLCSTYQVALVFAVFIVYNNDKLAFFEVFERFFDAVEFYISHILYLIYIYFVDSVHDVGVGLLDGAQVA